MSYEIKAFAEKFENGKWIPFNIVCQTFVEDMENEIAFCEKSLNEEEQEENLSDFDKEKILHEIESLEKELEDYKNLEKSDKIYPVSIIHSYPLFSALSNFCNEDGFVVRNIISLFRGMPNDVSNDVKEFSENSEENFGYSWVSLKELVNYNWESLIDYDYYVNPKQYAQYKNGHNPSFLCKSLGKFINEEDIVSNKEMDKIIKNNKSKHCYTKIRICEPIKKHAEQFIQDVIPELIKNSKKDDYSDVRLVFWFNFE